MSTKVTDLTSDELLTHIQYIIDALDNFNGIVGDTPVSEQLSIALSQMASKSHAHENYVTRTEYDTLKQVVDTLISLVGDTSVTEQISAAINNRENT